jgi:primosomal protein N' (replication factor Y)
MSQTAPYAAVVPDTRSILPKDVFTYSVPLDLDALAVPGARVEVPFGTRTVTGYVVERSHAADVDAPRALTSVLDEPPLLDPSQVAVALWIADRYVAPLGEVIKAMLPAGVRSAKPGGRKRSGPRSISRSVAAIDEAAQTTAPQLNDAQQQAAAPLLQAIDEQRHLRLLLHGVTGSGKTEVYLAAITRALQHGRGAIVLVPEISLTPQTVARFAGRFPGRVALVHSALTDAERAVQWRRIRDGEADVVVGSRSAVFAPLRHPGVIVVDEEDAGAYKQDRVPRYNAVDVALELGRLHGIPVVLGSATPRVETFFRAKTGAMEYAELPERIAGRALPPIEVIDLCEELRAGNRSPLSLTLERALRECHEAGGQSILFLNRRGSATVIVCRACGAVLTCPNCSVSMVYHHGRARCDCHYCGSIAPVPMTCPSCHSPSIKGLGMGTERLEHEVQKLFPQLRLLRMDRDTVAHRDAYYDIYEKFRNHEADCLIGTQMVAKGWDLAGVRLVGIVNADTALHFPDYRSGEITFSLLTQVAGRAGRGDEPARVVLQTYSPDHYAVRHALTHDYLNFARDEIRIRKALHFPPYSRLVQCTYAHKDDAKAEHEARLAVEKVSGILGSGDGLDVLGPAPAFLHRLRGEYRWQFTVRGEAIERTFPHLPRARGWSIDVDPAP